MPKWRIVLFALASQLGGCASEPCENQPAQARIDVKLEGVAEPAGGIDVTLNINNWWSKARHFSSASSFVFEFGQELDKDPRTIRIMAVAYDAAGKAIGFGELTDKFKSNGCNPFAVRVNRLCRRSGAELVSWDPQRKCGVGKRVIGGAGGCSQPFRGLYPANTGSASDDTPPTDFSLECLGKGEATAACLDGSKIINNSLRRVVSQDDSNSQTSATCTPGSQLVGGGCECLSLQQHIVSSFPDFSNGATWKCNCSAGGLKAWAVCLVSTSFTTEPGNAAAGCDGGSQLIGGGCQCSGPLKSSIPDPCGETWTCDCGAGATAFAICAR